MSLTKVHIIKAVALHNTLPGKKSTEMITEIAKAKVTTISSGGKLTHSDQNRKQSQPRNSPRRLW
jgi:hypothetical protein